MPRLEPGGTGTAPARRKGAKRHQHRWPPLTITREALLVNGADDAFRALMEDLLTMADQLQQLRKALARGLGVSEPQYRLFLAIAKLEGRRGVGVAQAARSLRVTGAFVTMVTRELVRRGYVEKRPDPEDGRSVLLSLTEGGRAAFAAFAAQPQAINDALFQGISAAQFRTLAALARRLVVNGEAALQISQALAQQQA